MDVDRALLTSALQSGAIPTLLSHGIESRMFAQTHSGEDCAEVFSWAAEHARRFNASPSLQLVHERFPNWRAEPASDPLEALIEAFKSQVKRRAFSAKVLELARAESDPTQWPRLDEVMLDAARDLAALIPSGRVQRMSEMRQRVEDYEREREAGTVQGIEMGIPVFDELTNGIQAGELVTIAGFSGLGKSMLSQLLLMNALEQQKNGLLLSLEMTARQIFERLDTMVLNFSHKLLRRRELADEDVALWRRIAAQYAAMDSDLVVVDRMMGATIERVYAEINRYKPDVAVVDYVQLMRSTRRAEKRWETLVDVTNEMKEIALATDSAIIMVSQDGRGSAEEGSTERNAGGSISVYQAADIYLGLFQDDEMYAQERMEVRLLKNRSGERRRNARLLWRPSHMEIQPLPDDGEDHRAFTRAG